MAHLTHWKRQLKSHLFDHAALDSLLAPEVTEDDCRQAGHCWRASFWSPATTLTTFLLQVLSAEKTLRACVAALLTQLAARGETHLPSVDASAYCQARIRLPGEAIMRPALRVVDQMRDLVDADALR